MWFSKNHLPTNHQSLTTFQLTNQPPKTDHRLANHWTTATTTTAKKIDVEHEYVL